MRSVHSKSICMVAVATMLAMAVTSTAQRAAETYAPSDTTFYEIMLSDDGVVAVDTAGYEWYYDFDRGQWEAGIPEPDEVDSRSIGIGTGDDDQEPISERCTVKKWIKPAETRPVMIGFDEYVDGDIIVLDRVTIKGWVTGDVRSLGKRVLVTETGWVDGNIEAPKVIVREGGYVGGTVVEEASPLDFDLKSPFSVVGIIVAASFTALLLLSTLLVVTVAPRHCENFCDCLEANKAKTFFLGFLLWLLLPPLLVLVIITIVGAFVVWLVPLAYFAAASIGMIAFGNMIGRVFACQFLGGEKGRLFQTLVGILLTMSLWFISATLLGANGGTAEGFGVFFLVVAILVTAFPAASGLGAAFLTRFGFREYRGWKDRTKSAAEPPPPAPPPLRSDHLSPEPPNGSPTIDET